MCSGGLPQGAYALEADLPGFETFQETLTLRGDDLTREITLNVGTIQEVVSVSSAEQRPRQSGRPHDAASALLCLGSGPTDWYDAIRSSPCRRRFKAAPKSISRIAALPRRRAAQESIRINALIGRDGFVTDTEVASNPSPALAQAAVEAVRQWEFDPTLLNCEPVEVRMTVVVDFR